MPVEIYEELLSILREIEWPSQRERDKVAVALTLTLTSTLSEHHKVEAEHYLTLERPPPGATTESKGAKPTPSTNPDPLSLLITPSITLEPNPKEPSGQRVKETSTGAYGPPWHD